jgi:hypothetical protein
VNKCTWSLLSVLCVVAVITMALSATPVHSSSEGSDHPKLTVESCLVQGTDVFRLRATNWNVAGEWRLKLHHGSETITIGELEAREQVGALDWTATITTTIEGTWRKQFLEGDEWVDRNGAHSLSVQTFTENGWFCPPGPTYDLGDRVWYDTDQDGEQDGGEPGVEGITVLLYNPSSTSATYTYSQTTGLDGGYLFTDLVTGTYCLQFLDIPDGWQITVQDEGRHDAIDSDADRSTARIESIDLHGDDLDQDVGLYVDGSIGDRVWCDHNGNTLYDAGEGLDNVTVSLLDDSNCDGWGGTLLETVETGSEGDYAFTNLDTGPRGATDQVCYVVAVDTTDADLGTCSLPVGAASLGLRLTADEFDNQSIDFLFHDQVGYPGPFRSFCPLVSMER